MRTRRAYLLTEMLLIIALFGVLLLISGGPVRTLFAEVLGTQKVFECQDQVELLLMQLREHAEHAETATVRSTDPLLGGDLLVLTGPGGTVCYQFTDGAAVCVLENGSREWVLPQVVFEWELAPLGGGRQALAMTTRHTPRGWRKAPAFRGSQVFVIGLNGGLERGYDDAE